MIDRRHVLAAAAAAALAPVLPAAARAPLAGNQVPGIYRRKLGDLEITAILDGYIPFDTKVFSGSDPAAIRQSLANAIRDILIEQTASGSTRSTARPASG